MSLSKRPRFVVRRVQIPHVWHKLPLYPGPMAHGVGLSGGWWQPLHVTLPSLDSECAGGTTVGSRGCCQETADLSSLESASCRHLLSSVLNEVVVALNRRFSAAGPAGQCLHSLLWLSVFSPTLHNTGSWVAPCFSYTYADICYSRNFQSS